MIGSWLDSVPARPFPEGKPECRLAARSATLPVLRSALIAGNESGRGSVTHRADPVTLPSMVQRDQRNHFPPPVLTGLVPLSSQRLGHPVHPSRPPRRSQYIPYHTAITVNPAFLPPLCPETSTAGKLSTLAKAGAVPAFRTPSQSTAGLQDVPRDLLANRPGP